MRNTFLVTVCTVIATALMALGVSTATARNIDVSNQTFRVTFSDIEFAAGEIRNDCHVTLEGSLHSRTMPKVEGTLIGYITRVTTAQCSLGTTILTETLPWHVRYVAFSGTLPEITLFIIKVRENFRVITCLAAGDVTARLIRNTTTREVTGDEVPLERNSALPLTGVLCPAPRIGSLRSNGNGSVMVLGATTRITVTLI